MIDSRGCQVARPPLTSGTRETAQRQAWACRTAALILVRLWAPGRCGQAPPISRFALAPPGINHLGWIPWQTRRRPRGATASPPAPASSDWASPIPTRPRRPCPGSSASSPATWSSWRRWVAAPTRTWPCGPRRACWPPLPTPMPWPPRSRPPSPSGTACWGSWACRRRWGTTWPAIRTAGTRWSSSSPTTSPPGRCSAPRCCAPSAPTTPPSRSPRCPATRPATRCAWRTRTRCSASRPGTSVPTRRPRPMTAPPPTCPTWPRRRWRRPWPSPAPNCPRAPSRPGSRSWRWARPARGSSTTSATSTSSSSPPHPTPGRPASPSTSTPRCARRRSWP